MEQRHIAAKMFGVLKRGPLSMHPTWEVLSVRMLRLLVQIEEAEKARASYQGPPAEAPPDEQQG